MKTDDLLADLERQLRAARPARRGSRVLPALAAIGVVVAVVAVLVSGGGTSDERAVDPAPSVTVLVRNGTGYGPAGRAAARTLRGLGYAVEVPTGRAARGYEPGDRTGIIGDREHRADAQRIATALDFPASVVSRGYNLPGPDVPNVVVALGNDFLNGPYGAPLKRVTVLGTVGRPEVERRVATLLGEAGLGFTKGAARGAGSPSHTMVIVRSPADARFGEAAQGALRLPRRAPRYATRAQLDAMDGAGVLVLIGRDYTLP